MAISRGFERFYNFLANLGLVLRDDPPKVIDMTGREWGASVNGLALSIREIPRDDPRELAVLSVLIRNEGPEEKKIGVPGWMFFYQVEVVGPDGSRVPPTPYGRRLLQAERKTERMEVVLGRGDARETDLPAGALYSMRNGESYRVRVSCVPEDKSVLASNEIVVRA